MNARLGLYRSLLRARLVEERIAELYPAQEMRCPVHLSIGQEAAAVGVCAALRPGDWALSGHRSHGHYLAKGGDLKAMLAELYGKATGCCGGKGGSMHFIDRKAGFMGATPIVGSTIAMAVGAAFGSRLKGEKRVVVSFLGDAAVEEGVFHEAANFAVLKKLPVLFACENNLYSVYSPLSVRQPKGRSIAKQAASYGMPAWTGDGNDAEKTLALAKKAVAWARTRGPAFLELSTYRWREHCGPNYDNHIGYRTEAEFKAWKKRDPVASFKARLVKAKLLDEGRDAALRAELAAEIDAAVAFARESPYPEPKALLSDVYAGAA
ncbi:MAG: thiamine pyrophosphate-dependent dehydrogenase E1 component subunit alpha [Elusimicrobiota bacterium]|nr:thiamine pyrophosphate-dependent dehydrogenase E1 component subunit alpha [Elusimicrobiota bacterium]